MSSSRDRGSRLPRKRTRLLPCLALIALAAPIFLAATCDLGWLPEVEIVRPTDQATVGGNVTIEANVTHDRGVLYVTCSVDGQSIPMLLVSGDELHGVWEGSWDVSAIADGSHTVAVTATDTMDLTGTDSVIVVVDNAKVASGSAEVHLRAKVIRPCSSPPFNYAIASTDSDLTITGSTVIASSPEEHDGDIYANGKIRLTGSVTVDGDAISTSSIRKVGAATITGEETEYLDPPLEFPSEQEIQVMAQQYQGQAEGGGFHYGNYSKTGSGTYQLGPVHITGDLKLTGSVRIELQGTVYVDGKIRMTGSSEIVGPGTLVAESNIKITGGGRLEPDDLPVIMSVYGDIKCTGSAEIAALLYAPNGEIKLTGSADLYGAAVGSSVSIGGSRTITYCTDLRDCQDLPGDPDGGEL